MADDLVTDLAPTGQEPEVGNGPIQRAKRRRGAPGQDQVKWRDVSTDDQLLELVDEVLQAPVYGIDTEFHRERTYWPHLALLQVAWPSGIALIDPLAVDVKVFGQILSGPGLAVLHAADQDLEVLERATGVIPRELFDTQLSAGFLGLSTPSLGSLVEYMLGLRLDKGDQLTDWTRRPLTQAQKRYAACDVAYLLELQSVICKQLESRGRLEWAKAECLALLERPRTPSDPCEIWWRLKQSRQLHGQSKGVAQCVVAWREQRARNLDIPARFVLSDLAVASIAQRPPRNRAELLGVRNLDSRHLADGVEGELLDAIERGRALSADELRTPPVAADDSTMRPAVALATSWLQDRAYELGLDSAILATRHDVAMYLRDNLTGRIATTWRAGLVGNALVALANGDAAIAFGDKGKLILEKRSRTALDSGNDGSAS